MGESDSFIKFLQKNSPKYWPLYEFLCFMQRVIQYSRDGRGVGPSLECYYNNVEGFNATYVFTTEDKTFQATARFIDGVMTVEPVAAEEWNLKIVFKDVPAFWRLIISGGNNIVDAILANEAQVYGNLNYLYKLGFLVKDLINRFELD
ncbi:MAG: hypothetical protein WCJ75_04600 [Desulfomonile sp.]